MSGTDAWQREVPPNWTVRPLRSVAEYAVSNVDKIPSKDELPVRLCNYTDVYNNETIHLGMEFMVGTATQAEIDKFHLLADDVVITKDSESWDDIAIPALVTETADAFVCGYHLAMIRPDPEKLDGAFLFRCLQSKTLRIQLELSANGITRFGIPKNAIGSMALPVPPTPIQRAIARFLDRETADIDALIAAKQRLLDLLAEKRRAIVAEAVMRGLTPPAPLRPSGIDWLGDVPAHWEACHLKRVLACLDYGTSESTDVSGSVAILRMGDIRDGELDFSKLAYLDQVEDGLLLREGDLVFNRTNSLDQIGKVALFRGNVDFPVSFASYLVRLRCEDTVLPEYLNWVLNSSYALAWARAEALPSSGQANLNPSRYGYLPIALPPLAEQRTITKHLTETVARLDGIRAATEHSITLLKERRAALIAEAVMRGVALSNQQTLKLKYAVELRRNRVEGADSDRPYVGLENIESGTGRLIASATTEATEGEYVSAVGDSLSAVFEAGDILFGKLRPYLAKAWIAEFNGRCSTQLLPLRPEKIDPRFGLYVILSQQFIDAVDASTFGSNMPRADWELIGNLPIPSPTQRQQSNIARFLDRETADIDALIAAKQRLLDLLAEERRAIVAEAVMRGLTPPAPLRPSGIDWLGDIPAHWEAIPLRFLVSFNGGATPDTRKLDYWSGAIPWVSPKDMKRDFIDDAEDHVSEAALDNSALKMIEPNGILIVVRGMILAHSFPTAINTVPVTINQDMKALRCVEKIAPAFLVDVLKGAKDYLVSLADSSAHGTKKLETEALGRFEVPVPPLAEQHEIVRHIAAETAKIDRLRAATEHSITLLKERRAALIAAAVTGQIDIPEAA